MINDKHKFIFIHVPKTGGSSVAQFFAGTTMPRYKHMLTSADPWMKRGVPWDRAVSMYYFRVVQSRTRRRCSKNLSFKQFLKHPRCAGPRAGIDQTHWLLDDKGNMCMDYVGRYEDLQGSLDYVCDRVGVARGKIPHKTSTKRLRDKDYWEYYDDETRELIAKRFKRDIETFNYEFEK